MTRTLKTLFLLAGGGLLLLGVVSCAPVNGTATATTTFHDDVLIDEDTTWSGRILIDGTVKVARDATLTIAPGTEIAFVRRDADADGLGDAVLAVEGRLVAVGTRAAPIRFHSAAELPQPGDWLEIRVDFAREIHLRYCDIRDSAYTLHAHFTRGVVEDCTIHHNIDGCRLGQATFTFRNNLIEHNQGKGINFRNSTVAIHHNILRFNGSGIFLFENDREIDVHDNNFYGNLDNFRLGDFYAGDVSLQHNWWGTADLQEARATLYDRSRDPEIGTVSVQPSGQWVPGTGPRDALEIREAWTYATDGYIDADLIARADRLSVASWDGHLHVLNREGGVVWTRNLNDTIDATPALDKERLFVQTWSREVYALDAASGDLLWRFDFSPSRADDHRQGGLLVIDGRLLVPAWNGTLFALDAATGEKLWSFAAGQPLRARPAHDGRLLYLASGDGTLSALSDEGVLRWQKRLDAPLLSSPTLIPQGVVVVNREGQVFAFDPAGQPLWQQPLAEPCYYGRAVYDDDALYLATAGGRLWKLDATSGVPVWGAPLAGPSYAAPLVDNGRVYIGDNNGVLQVYGADSGDLIASTVLEREIQGRPLSWSDLLLVGSRDHQVHAFRVVEKPLP